MSDPNRSEYITKYFNAVKNASTEAAKKELLPANLESIRKTFGYGSDIFQSAMLEMHKAYTEIENTPEMQKSYDQWESFLTIAYGNFKAGKDVFLIHSYLSVLAKILAYEAISGDSVIGDSTMLNIVNGEFFRRKNISNFTDNDFFTWTSQQAQFFSLKEAFRTIATGLAQFDFSIISEDILKGVYQELIDEDTKHSLGEHYTPDWLCTKIVSEINPQKGQRILDPSCGSGSFLKAVVDHLIANNPDISLKELNDCLFGIDIHPLSVQIAKSTLLIAYGKRLICETRQIHLNIFLANTLLLSHKKNQLYDNNYDSVSLKGQFDIVVGNPPWLTYKDIISANYQEKIIKIAILSNVLPKGMKLRSHLDLAAVFLGHCLNYFLKPQGKLAFVLPRAFFTAEQHKQTREGKICYLKIAELWDLSHVENLFKIPSCVMFCLRGKKEEETINEIVGKNFSGKLPTNNCNWTTASEKISIKKTTVFLSYLNRRSAWTLRTKFKYTQPSFYITLFKNGAMLTPRRFCFVDINQEILGTLQERLVQIISSEAVSRDSKLPWRNLTILGAVKSKFFFTTALANNIVPFGLNGTFLITLPVVVENGRIALRTPQEMEESGEIQSATWFRQASTFWDQYKTQKNKNKSWSDNLNEQKTLISQKLDFRYLTLYTASGKNAVSTVIDRNILELPFIADCKTYVFFTNSLEEAQYITAFLNSSIANNIIKPFQTTGLFGPRDIHKRILEIPFPKYDPSDADHATLVALAEKASQKVATFIADQHFDSHGNNMNAGDCGRFRNAVRTQIAEELEQIDNTLCAMLKI